jgi:DNA-directed RNA polymerase subunit RPC12/RpoP
MGGCPKPEPSHARCWREFFAPDTAAREATKEPTCPTCGHQKYRQRMWKSAGNFGYCSDSFHATKEDTDE